MTSKTKSDTPMLLLMYNIKKKADNRDIKKTRTKIEKIAAHSDVSNQQYDLCQVNRSRSCSGTLDHAGPLLKYMAISGTEHFAGKGIIDMLEKNEVRFGSDINTYTAKRPETDNQKMKNEQ